MAALMERRLTALVRTSRMRLAMPGSSRRASKRSLLSFGVAARSCTYKTCMSLFPTEYALTTVQERSV